MVTVLCEGGKNVKKNRQIYYWGEILGSLYRRKPFYTTANHSRFPLSFRKDKPNLLTRSSSGSIPSVNAPSEGPNPLGKVVSILQVCQVLLSHTQDRSIFFPPDIAPNMEHRVRFKARLDSSPHTQWGQNFCEPQRSGRDCGANAADLEGEKFR